MLSSTYDSIQVPVFMLTITNACKTKTYFWTPFVSMYYIPIPTILLMRWYLHCFTVLLEPNEIFSSFSFITMARDINCNHFRSTYQYLDYVRLFSDRIILMVFGYTLFLAKTRAASVWNGVLIKHGIKISHTLYHTMIQKTVLVLRIKT